PRRRRADAELPQRGETRLDEPAPEEVAAQRCEPAGGGGDHGEEQEPHHPRPERFGFHATTICRAAGCYGLSATPFQERGQRLESPPATPRGGGRMPLPRRRPPAARRGRGSRCRAR